MTGISFYCFLWRLISVRRVRASNGRQNRFFYRSHRNGQSRKNIVFMRLCGVSGIHFLRHGEQIILLFFISFPLSIHCLIYALICLYSLYLIVCVSYSFLFIRLSFINTYHYKSLPYLPASRFHKSPVHFWCPFESSCRDPHRHWHTHSQSALSF